MLFFLYQVIVSSPLEPRDQAMQLRLLALAPYRNRGTGSELVKSDPIGCSTVILVKCTSNKKLISGLPRCRLPLNPTQSVSAVVDVSQCSTPTLDSKSRLHTVMHNHAGSSPFRAQKMPTFARIGVKRTNEPMRFFLTRALSLSAGDGVL